MSVISKSFIKRWFGKRLNTIRNNRKPRAHGNHARLFLEPLEERVLLATLTVTNPTDILVANETSLRQAVVTADADAAAGVSDTIVFDPSLGSSIISLTQGTLELSGSASATITIDGSSPSTPITIDGILNGDDRVFTVDSGVQAVIQDLNIQRSIGVSSNNGGDGGAIFNAGTLSVANVNLTNNTGSAGGAIENQGTLTLSNVVLANNQAHTTNGGALDNSGTATVIDCTLSSNSAPSGTGGAIANAGTLTVSGTTFTGNGASGDGGALDNSAGSATVTSSFFTGNYSYTPGGVIENEATLQVSGTTISNNSDYDVSGIIDNSGTLTVTGVTLSNNNGGGLDNNGGSVTVSATTASNNIVSGGVGAVFDNVSGAMTLTNTTVSGNNVTSAALSSGGSLTLLETTVSANTGPNALANHSGTLTLQNTIVAGNTNSASADIAGVITTDNGNNLLGKAINNNTTDPTPGAGDLFSDTTGLGALGNYGGSTQTMDVLAGSPALGAGNDTATNLPATDERGLPRTVSGQLDIGAFQTQPPTVGFLTLGQTFTAGQPATVTVDLLNVDGNPETAGSGGVTVSLATSSSGGSFFDAFGNALSGNTITIPSGSSSLTFEYADTTQGTPTLTVSAAGFASAAQQETVLAAPIAATPATDIVVGRTLSAYFTSDVQNNQETITFTVYNQQATSITGVLLTDTLEPGVTFVNASQLPDQSGQNLAWSLGTIEGDYWTSVTMTVSLANSNILQLDTGAQAFATLNAGPISNATPAAELTPGSVDPNLLASTPDANTTDPYIQQEAAILDYNSQNIFNFLQQNIGYNAYTGSLRGARGTLWSDAGNALDVSSLGVALMRASGIPAQYVEGTLSAAQAQTLLLSMFPNNYQTVGYIPAGTTVTTASTLDNTFGEDGNTLQGETESHYWFEFNTGNGWVNADPLMAGARIGQTFTAATGTFTVVAQSLRQTTNVSLTAEIYSQAAAEFFPGDAFTDTVVLNQTFNDVDLVGVPLSVGNFVNGQGIGAGPLSLATFTYSPYIRIESSATPDDDPIIAGTNYQEQYTNFPLGSQILTGLFLNVSFVSLAANGEQQTTTVQKVLFDRIGFAGRQSGTSPTSLDLSSAPQPALTSLDIVTLDVSAEAQSTAQVQTLSALVGQLVTQDTQLASNLSQSTPADMTPNMQDLSNVTLDNVIETSSLLGATFLADSDQFTSASASQLLADVYFDSPRLVAISSLFTVDSTTQQVGLTYNLDILQDSPQVVAAPGQSAQINQTVHYIHGFADSVLEGLIMSPSPSGGSVQPTSAMGTLLAAVQAGVGSAAITSANLADLDALSIPAEAKARIAAAAESGLLVLVPTVPVMVNGTPSIAWLEINPTTGDAVAVAEDGTHGSTEMALAYTLVDDLILVGLQGGTEASAVAAGEEAGLLGSSLIREAAEVEASNLVGLARKQAIVEAIQAYSGSVLTKLKSVVPSTGGFTFYASLSSIFRATFGGAFEASVLKIVEGVLEKDPELPTLLGQETPQPVLESTSSEGVSIPVGLSPGQVTGTLTVPALQTTGALVSTWTTAAVSGFAIQTLTANATTVLNGSGQVVGAGTVGLSLSDLIAASISGSDQYTVTGEGALAVYGPAESNLGVSGNWDNYSATVTGNVSISLTSAGLTLNGQTLAAGTYTIITNSAIVSGSGQTTAPNFAGSASITTTGGTINLGAGSRNVTLGGTTLNVTNGATLDDYTGSITVAAGGANSTDSVTLNGNATNALSVSATPGTLTLNQNTTTTFQVNINTTLADTYTITTQAPAGWEVAIDSSGVVTVTPAPGLQGGTYPIQVVVQSSTDPALVAQTTLEVTMTPTQPGMTLAVNPNTLFTVPYNGAELPTAFQALIHNSGPSGDTYNLSFANIPSGFSVVSSGTSVTVPAGQTGIVGIYLIPVAGSTLPAPGTPLSFQVTATSATTSSITQTVTASFIMPVVNAVAVTANPVLVSAVPGQAGSATITLQNVGNDSTTQAILVSTSTGLTASGLSSPVKLGLGGSDSQTLTLTPAANTPLNSSLGATLTIGPAVTQNVVSVVNVTPSSSFAEAGQTITVSADVLNGVTATEQAEASFTVLNGSDSVVFSSDTVPLTLSTLTNVATVNLGSLDTSSLAPGQYTIDVSIADGSGTPIPGATGTASLVIDAPVTASLAVSSDAVSPADVPTVFDTLTVGSQTQLGSVATDGEATSVVVNGNLAYVANTQDIAIVNVSDPTNPQIVTTFGSTALNQGGLNQLQLDGSNLIVASENISSGTSFNLLVYSLSNPSSPQLLSNTTIPYDYPSDLVIQGNTAFISLYGISSDGNGNITDQYGDFLAVDLSNPAAPTLAEVLFNNRGTPKGSNSDEFDAVPINSQITYVAGTTSTGANTQSGSGQVLIVNTANPAAMSVADQLDIPGTVQAVAIAVNGNEALVVGSTGGWQSPFTEIGLTGNVTLTMLNISNPLDPTIMGSTVVTQETFPNNGDNAAPKPQAIYLGNGEFAVSDTLLGAPVLLVVNTGDPSNLVTSTVPVTAAINGMTVSGDRLLTTSSAGLEIYQINGLTTQTVTAEVTVPTSGVAALVPNSFSLAPNQIIPGSGVETLVWNLTVAPAGASQQITWETSVSGLASGQVVAVATGANIQVGSVTYTLGTSNVAGIPETQTLEIPVYVGAPGVPALANAAVTAEQVGNTNLANQLNNLSTALTNLVQTPSSAVYLSQAEAAIVSLISQLDNDPFLNSYTGPLSGGAAALYGAATVAEVDTAVLNLGATLDSLSQTISDEAAYGFTLTLADSDAVILPGAPTVYNIVMQNTGTATATYDFSISGLPSGVSATFSQSSITLAPGASIPEGSASVTLSLSESGTTLIPADFTVTATAVEASEITLGTPGQLDLRPETIQVGTVTTNPPFTNPGGQVDVTAQIESVVNEPQQVVVSYTVTDANGNVLFTDPSPTSVALAITSGLTTVDLGTFDTTGFAPGPDIITVTVLTQSQTSTYDAVNDFSINANPNGSWSYLYENGSALEPLTITIIGLNGVAGVNAWYNGENEPNAVTIFQNTTDSTPSDLTIVQPPDLLGMDPDADTAVVTRWTAPNTGTWNISGLFQGIDTNEQSPDVEILENSSTVLLAPTTIASFGQQVSFSYNVTLTEGDTIDFLVLSPPGGNGKYLSTGLSATISALQPLPTATAMATVTIGLPVTATLTASPTVLPTGTGLVTNTLDINSTIPLIDPLTIEGDSTTTPASTIALYQDSNDTLAYVGGPYGIGIVNVANPAAPVDLGTFGQSDIVQGYEAVVRVDEIGGANYLIVGTTGTLNVSQFTLLIYSLANPLSPSLVSQTAIPYAFLDDLLVEGNTVLVPTDSYYLFAGILEGQYGTVLSIDVSNPASPQLEGELYNNEGPPHGGDFTMFGGVIANSSIAYVGSSTSSGYSTQDGVGQVLVVNDATPASLTATALAIPGTYQVLGVGIQGNQALVLGRTGGSAGAGTGGIITLSVLDITNPQSPQLIGTTLVTNAQTPPFVLGAIGLGGGSILPLGNGLFAVSDGSVNGNPEILIVDTSDPNNIVVAYAPVTANATEMAVSGSLLYVTSAQGLTIFNIGQLETVPVSASVVVPNNTGVSIDSESITVTGAFNAALPQVIQGTSSDTVTWSSLLTYGASNVTITFLSLVSGLEAGEVLPVTSGTSVAFNSQNTPGTVTLPGTSVLGVSFLSLIPNAQTTQPGGTVTYELQLTNPTTTPVTYNLGIPGFSIAIPTFNYQVPVAPGATVDEPLVFTDSPDFEGPGSYTFTVNASFYSVVYDPVTESNVTTANYLGSATGTFTLAGQPVLVANPTSYGVVSTFEPRSATDTTPAAAAVGAGTSAQYVLQITNTGSASDEYALQVTGLPIGAYSTLSQQSITIPPGASNFRDVTVTVSDYDATPGDYSFTFTATSDLNSSENGTATGTVTVTNEGVEATLSPTSDSPGSTLDFFVQNFGTAEDTFKLTLSAPAALAANLGQATIALAPGVEGEVPITTNAASFADPGTLGLIATATSETNPAVMASSSASLTIPVTTGMTAQFQPSAQTLPQPGSTSFQLLVNNTGNSSDSYTATIVGTTGGVTASLIGLDGNPTQSILVFILPGLSTGALTLQTTSGNTSQGTVTVQIQSLSNGAIMNDQIATLNLAISPVVVAPTSLPDGTFDTVYSSPTITATGGTSAGFTFSESGKLPAGLTFNAAAAQFVGTPTQAGVFPNIVVTATDNNNDTGSETYTLTVNPGSTTTTVTSSLNPSQFGQTVVFTAAVSVGSDTFDNGGSVQFAIDGSDFGAPVSLTNGSATIGDAALGVSNYTITATYSGDTDFGSSSGTLSGGQTVNPGSTTTTVSSSLNPSQFGQTVIFTAAVSAGSDTFDNGGTVQFAIDGSDFGAPVSLTNGSATIGDAALGVSNYTITATYSGDTDFGSSSGTLSGGQTVNPGSTTTTVSSSLNPSQFGQTVIFTAAVSVGSDTFDNGGTVQFAIDGSDFGAPVSLTNGSATIGDAALGVGNHTITGVYSGDTDFGSSNGTLGGGQTVLNPVVVSPASLPGGEVGDVYASPTITAMGGTNTGFTFAETGTLPAGLTFNMATDQFDGTPTQFGSFPDIVVTATDSNGDSGSETYTLTVAPSVNTSAVVVSPTSLPDGTVGDVYASPTITAMGGTNTGFTFKETGALPAGLTFNTATDQFDGTPTQAGTFSDIVVTATDSNGDNGSQTYTLTVNPAFTLPAATLPTGTVGQPGYSATIGTEGAVGSVTFALTSGAFPPGLSFNPTTGVLSGTPTTAGTFNFTIGATDSAGDTTSQSYSTTIAAVADRVATFDSTRATWTIDVNGNGVAPLTVVFGLPGDHAIVGDWNGTGLTEIGTWRVDPDVFAPDGKNALIFSLDYNGDDQWDSGDVSFIFGEEGDQVVVGDWNGDGKDEIGVVRPGSNGVLTWSLDLNDTLAGYQNDPNNYEVYHYGLAGDQVVTGDWTGAGKDEIGVVRPDLAATLANGSHPLLWSLDYAGTGVYSGSYFTFGTSLDTLFLGDWTGDGKTQVGTARPDANGVGMDVSLDLAGTGIYNPNLDSFYFGRPGDMFFSGDWIASGKDSLGVARPGNASQLSFSLDTNGDGLFEPSDAVFMLAGQTGDSILVGKWQKPS